MTIPQLKKLISDELQKIKPRYPKDCHYSTKMAKGVECVDIIRFEPSDYYLYMDYENKRSIKICAAVGGFRMSQILLNDLADCLKSVTNRVTRTDSTVGVNWAYSYFSIPNAAIAEHFQRGSYILGILTLRAMQRDKLL